MDHFKGAFFLLFVGFLCSTYSFAYLKKGDSGQEVFSFMNTFDSPRNAALEKSAAAQRSKDPSIIQLNPAAFYMDEPKHIAAMHWQTGAFAENQGSIYFTSALKNFYYQIAYHWLSYGSIEGYDVLGEPTGEEYNPLSQLITASLTVPFKHIQFGFTVKVASDKLADERDDQTAWGAAFDWGASWISASKSFGVSFIARDFGCLLRDYVDDDENTYYPMSQTFALALFFRPALVRRLTLFMENDFPRYAEPKLNLGAEYALGSHLNIRAGFTRTWLDLTRDFKQLSSSNSRPSESNEARMVSFGLGYNHRIFGLDYSFSFLSQSLGIEHHVGLRVEF